MENKAHWLLHPFVAQAPSSVFCIPRSFTFDDMASSGSRAFGTSTKAALKWAGASKSDILTQNPGERGEQALKAIEKIELAAEQKVGRCSNFYYGAAKA